jgi:hypothetical protein
MEKWGTEAPPPREKKKRRRNRKNAEASQETEDKTE